MVRLPGEVFRDRRLLDALGRASIRVAGGIGAAFLLISILIGLFVEGAADHFWRAYLVSFSYFLSLSLGARISKPTTFHVPNPAGLTRALASPVAGGLADLEVGDTAGLETCATPSRSLALPNPAV